MSLLAAILKMSLNKAFPLRPCSLAAFELLSKYSEANIIIIILIAVSHHILKWENEQGNIS